MRSIQYRILSKLLETVSIPDYIYAFEKGKSIPTMASKHTGCPVVISLDIKDFFPSITQATLYSLFCKYGMGQAPSRTVSELCTIKSRVPQGALTSPKLSNIIAAHSFGPRVKELCDKEGWTLTIYADDITMSSPDRNIISTPEGAAKIGAMIRTVSGIVKEYGFRVNTRKTKVMKESHRQYVCGTVVNQVVNLQKSHRNRLRAMVHNVVHHGVDAEALKSGMTPDKFASTLMGHVNWFNQLNPRVAGPLKDKLKEVIADQAAKATHEDSSLVVAPGESTDSPPVPMAEGAASATYGGSSPAPAVQPWV